jgi:rubrerythrin
MTNLTPTLIPTKLAGARARPAPGLYVDPMQQISDDELDSFAAGTGLDGQFVADLLSAMLAHEQCGRHLYRSCARRTNNPMLRSKYEHFGDETEQHVRILQQLIEACGGDAQYVSPQARLVHGLDMALVQSTYKLSGGVDPMTAEMGLLDAVFIAETMDHTNWSTLARLTERMSEGEVRDRFADAVARVESEEDEHLRWASDTKQRLVMMQAESGMMRTAAMKAEELVARIRSWFDGTQ